MKSSNVYSFSDNNGSESEVEFESDVEPDPTEIIEASVQSDLNSMSLAGEALREYRQNILESF